MDAHPIIFDFLLCGKKKILEIVCGRLDFWLRLPNFSHTSLELQAEIHSKVQYKLYIIHYVGKNSLKSHLNFLYMDNLV